MQTISVKYLNATTTKGARVKATTTGGHSLTEARDYSLEFSQQAARVALELKHKMEWFSPMVGGHTKDGMVFVFTKSEYEIA